MSIVSFLEESNRIEGIFTRIPSAQVMAAEAFLKQPTVTVPDMRGVVSLFQPDATIRGQRGMDVVVGNHYPPAGGPGVPIALEDLLRDAYISPDPYNIHCRYETLHPFMDGNGRSGRLLWAWQMDRLGRPWRQRGFLHTWYYQSLSALRRS